MTAPLIGDVDIPQTHGYVASLGELLVRGAVSPGIPLTIKTADLQLPRFQTESSAEEALPGFGDIHSQGNFGGGEGLIDRFRRRGSPADPTRFWASEHVDISPVGEGRPDDVRLAPTTEVLDSISGTVRLATAGSVLWATSGNTLRKTSDVLAGTPVFADDDPHAGEAAGAVHDVAVLGDTPYAALGSNGVHRDTGAGWAHWADVEGVRVWSVLDRIVASDGQSLYEADAGAASVLLYTLPPGDTWTDAVDAGDAVLASASNGFVYAFTLNETADLEVVAQTKMQGETPVSLAARGGTVWVGTQSGDTARLWESPLSDRLTLNSLQLVREWDSEIGDLAATRDRVLVGVGDGFVWRIELASDGLSKAWEVTAGTVSGVTSVEGTLVVGVADSGIWRETSVLEEEGWLIGPLNDFFRAEDKSWVTGWADVKVPSGGRVELWFTTVREAMFDPDHAGWTRLRTYTSDSSGTELGLGGVVARSLAGMVRLFRADVESPRVRSFSFRAYPGGGDVIVQLPVDVGDQVERAGRRRTHVKGWGQQVYAALRARESKALTCTVYRTGDVVRGIVESVASPVPAVTPLGSMTVMSLVTVRGRRVVEPASLYGDGWGTSAWGVMSWGGS